MAPPAIPWATYRNLNVAPHARNRLLVIIIVVLFVAVLLGTSLKSLNSTQSDGSGGTMAPGMQMP